MQSNLDVVAGMLRKYKMQVDCVTTGQEAVNLVGAKDSAYNVVFIDHMMPGMDGIETAEKIREIGTKYAKKLSIIALTANAAEGSKEMFLKNGFQAFLSKPVNILELDAAVRKWVTKVK
jgi:CheY-like chemotaxis protein